jgi:hypothetical protein
MRWQRRDLPPPINPLETGPRAVAYSNICSVEHSSGAPRCSASRIPWADDGPTAIHHLYPLCRSDHTIRHLGWAYEINPDGTITAEHDSATNTPNDPGTHPRHRGNRPRLQATRSAPTPVMSLHTAWEDPPGSMVTP